MVLGPLVLLPFSLSLLFYSSPEPRRCWAALSQLQPLMCLPQVSLVAREEGAGPRNSAATGESVRNVSGSTRCPMSIAWGRLADLPAVGACARARACLGGSFYVGGGSAFAAPFSPDA